jgi:quercetin dioxygenase-like cupin family protein
VDAQQQHEGVGYQHEGEEFVYVLEGQIEVQVGAHINKLQAGDSLHFNSNIRHQMRNPGEVTTEMIVVVYSP